MLIPVRSVDLVVDTAYNDSRSRKEEVEVRFVSNPNQLATQDWDNTTVKVMRKLQLYVTQLEAMLPRDSLSRPLALVNPTAVLGTSLIQPLDVFLDEPPADAVLPVSYLDGVPTIHGAPIWELLEGEKLEYYKLFKRYRELQDDKGTRSIYKLHKETGIAARHLELIKQTHAWNARVTAFDAYVETERQHVLNVQQQQLQGRHNGAARQLFDQCTQYMLDNVQMLTPTTALKWAEMAIKLERLSVGLLPDKPGEIGASDGTTINIQNNVPVADTAQEHGTGATGDKMEDKQRLSQLLNVMDKIGLFAGGPGDVIEVDPVEDDDQ